MNSSFARYDIHQNPAYQVDCQIVSSGKRVTGTKRRVRFRFGFSNREALAQGLRGTHCRGEEHEVALVWSVTSGKRSVKMDGEEVHSSRGRFTDSMFETSWTMKGSHVLKLVAHVSYPKSQTPGVAVRQYDLFLDGCSYFNLPRIFELGVVNAVRKASKGCLPVAILKNVNVGRVEHMEHRQPLEQLTQHPNASRLMPEIPSEPDNAEVQSMPGMSNVQETYGDQHQHLGMDQACSVHAATAIDPSQSQNELALVPVESPPPFANQSFQTTNVWEDSKLESHTQYALSHTTKSVPVDQSVSQLASGYTAVSSFLNYASAPSFSQPSEAHRENHQYAESFGATSRPLPVIPPSSGNLSEQLGQSKLSAVNSALSALVNLDNINQTRESPEQAKADSASLQELQRRSQPRDPRREIMRTHAFHPEAPRAGIMVVYGTTEICNTAYGSHLSVGLGNGINAAYYAKHLQTSS